MLIYWIKPVLYGAPSHIVGISKCALVDTGKRQGKRISWALGLITVKEWTDFRLGAYALYPEEHHSPFGVSSTIPPMLYFVFWTRPFHQFCPSHVRQGWNKSTWSDKMGDLCLGSEVEIAIFRIFALSLQPNSAPTESPNMAFCASDDCWLNTIAPN